MTAPQIAAKALSDLKSAPSFTYAATDRSNGTTVHSNLGIKTGTGCAGRLYLGLEGNTTLVVIGRSTWVKPDPSVWKMVGGSAGARDRRLSAGKYIKGAAAGVSFQMSGACDVRQLASHLPMPADLAKGPLTTVSGQRALELTGQPTGSAVYVTDAAVPRILKIVSIKPGDKQQWTFTYGVPKTIKPPSASETIDGSRLGGS